MSSWTDVYSVRLFMHRNVVFHYCLAPLLLLSAVVLAQAQPDDDFWLLLDDPFAEHHLQLNAGVDTDADVYYGLQGDFSLNDRFSLVLGTNRQELEDHTEDWLVGVEYQAGTNIDWSLAYQWWGVVDVLETRDSTLKLYIYGDAWYGMAGIESGEVEFFTNALVQQTSGIFSGAIDHEAYSLGIGYSTLNTFAELSHTRHDYVSDLSLLPFVPRLWFIFKPETLLQSTALADYETELVLGLTKDDHQMQLSYSRVKSVVTMNSEAYLGLLLSKQLNPETSLGFEINMPLDEGAVSVGLLINFSW